MNLTLRQTADKLGKSVRQVRYMIRQGRLKAHKNGGRWEVDSDDLPVSPGQKQAELRRAARVRNVVEKALDLDEQTRRSYSMADLRAFQVAKPCHQKVAEALGPDHMASRSLRATLDLLAVGCHRFNHRETVSTGPFRST